jgi:chromosome segregation ATPase
MEHLERIKSAEAKADEAKELAMMVRGDLHEVAASIKNMSMSFSDLKDSVRGAMAQISNSFEKMSDMHSEIQVLMHDARLKDNNNREEHSRIDHRIDELKISSEKQLKELSTRINEADIEGTSKLAKNHQGHFNLVGKLILTSIILALLGIIIKS